MSDFRWFCWWAFGVQMVIWLADYAGLLSRDPDPANVAGAAFNIAVSAVLLRRSKRP